jgi:hypothetical protein
MSKPKYDSSVARVAGNIASGLVMKEHEHWGSVAYEHNRETIAEYSVALARAIIATVQRTQPAEVPDLCGNKVYQPNGSFLPCALHAGHSNNCDDFVRRGK